MPNLLKALIGLVLVFLVHLPRLFYLFLQLSYAAVFNNHPTLTANPAEHLKRAKRILRRGRLSELLYAAIELRFALERMAQRDLIFLEMASNRMLQEHDPSKQIANLHRLEPDAAFAHEIWVVNKDTGDRLRWGDYKPLDGQRVVAIQGRLGDLLHPKEGLNLGIWTDPWYMNTKAFLQETANYLSSVYTGNLGFFSAQALHRFEIIRK